MRSPPTAADRARGRTVSLLTVKPRSRSRSPGHRSAASSPAVPESRHVDVPWLLPHGACSAGALPHRFEAPGDNAPGVDADGRLRLSNGFRPAAHLDATGLPRRQHVVDYYCRAAATGDVPVLLGRCEVIAADVDGVELGVVCPADGDDVRCAVATQCCDAGQPALTAQIPQFLRSESAHGVCSRRLIRSASGIVMAGTGLLL